MTITHDLTTEFDILQNYARFKNINHRCGMQAENAFSSKYLFPCQLRLA